MTLKVLLVSALTIPLIAQAEPARRIVAVCPVNLKAGDFEPKLEKDLSRWVNEALIQKRIARADPAIVANELKTFTGNRCPSDEEGQAAFARSVGATDLLQVNVTGPAIVSGALVTLEKAEQKTELMKFVAGDPSNGPLGKVLREAVFTFIEQLPILPGEELISPLIEAPPLPDKTLPTPPAPAVVPAPAPKPVPSAAWALMGGGAATALGGGVSFLFAGMKEGDFNELLETRPWRSSGDLTRLSTLQRETGQLRTLGTALVAVGAVAGLAGAGWAIASQRPPQQPTVALQIGPGSMLITGRF